MVVHPLRPTKHYRIKLIEQNKKQFIELLLNQVVSENLDNVIQDIIGYKIEKKNKVLDLSDVAVSPKNDT